MADQPARSVPIATINGLVAWYAWKQVRQKETEVHSRADERERRAEARLDELRKAVRADADSEIRRTQETLKEAHAAHVASKDAEIARIAKQFGDELKKLATKIDGLTKQN